MIRTFEIQYAELLTLNTKYIKVVDKKKKKGGKHQGGPREVSRSFTMSSQGAWMGFP